MPARKRPEGTYRDKLEAIGADAIIDRLEAGETITEVAESLGVDRGDFTRWLNADAHISARAREAREKSAFALEERALAELQAIPKDATQGDIARAREVASHLRWQAKVRLPRVYSDRVQLDATVNVKAMDTDALMAQAKALGAKLGLAPPSADGD